MKLSVLSYVSSCVRANKEMVFVTKTEMEVSQNESESSFLV